MRKSMMLLLAFIPSIVFAQFGVSFHQSNLPFVGINYEIKPKLRAELRIGVDNYFDNASVEGVLTYDLVKKNDYEFYAGLGVRTNDFTGLVIPVGVNIYPFTVKQFGFHIELAPIVDESAILRGSWGIRYRFQAKEINMDISKSTCRIQKNISIKTC